MLRDWRKRRPPFELLDYSAHQIALAAGITYRRLNQILAGHQWPMGPIAHSRLSNVIDRVLRGELRFVGWNLAAGWIGGKTSAYDPRLERRWPY